MLQFQTLPLSPNFSCFSNILFSYPKGLLAPQNNFLDTIATRFDGTRKFVYY